MEGTGLNRSRLQSAITRQREATARRLERFGAELRRALGGDRSAVIGDHTCVYAVGSGGRGELTPKSDLDLFVVRVGKEASRLDAALVQAAILKASRKAGFPDPSGDGEWLKLHTVERFVKLLGSRDDDTENTFTARALLLLESHPVLGRVAYDRIIDTVISAYWTNASAHPRDYQPVLLINDIVRYWRILLLNYEARNIRQREKEASAATREAKRRLSSYKLRFSRCLTCYSALAYLLALTRGDNITHVTKEHVRAMVALSPLDRLQWVRERVGTVPDVPALVDRLLSSYLGFLAVADRGKAELERHFCQKKFRADRSREAREFGEAMFHLMSVLGQRSHLFRWIVV